MSNEALTRPIQPNEVEWRIQTARPERTIVVPYLTNRCVMQRFDEAFNPEGWQNRFQTWRDKGVKCGVGVFVDGGWVWKYDGADETQIEPTKGGFSDSMKRAAVQWGLGRDLYDYPRIFLEGEHKFIPDWAHDLLEKLVQAQIDGKLKGRSVITLKKP